MDCAIVAHCVSRRRRRRPALQGWKGHYFRGDAVNASVHRAPASLVTLRFCENAALDFLSGTMRRY